jgi:hypothetical protein
MNMGSSIAYHCKSFVSYHCFWRLENYQFTFFKTYQSRRYSEVCSSQTWNFHRKTLVGFLLCHGTSSLLPLFFISIATHVHCKKVCISSSFLEISDLISSLFQPIILVPRYSDVKSSTKNMVCLCVKCNRYVWQ